MISLDKEALKAYVWHYSQREGIIQPETWEKIICQSVEGGEWIGGDIYMADGKTLISGLNIKSVLKAFTKGEQQTVNVIQCRCPLEDVIKTLVDKRNASLKDFDLKNMVDVDIIHNRIGDDYNYRVFIKQQPKYEDENFTWKNGCAYKENSKQWKIKRNASDASAFQTCVLIKKEYQKSEAVVSDSVKSIDNYAITADEVKELYRQSITPPKSFASLDTGRGIS
jgi:hypothetical protein